LLLVDQEVLQLQDKPLEMAYANKDFLSWEDDEANLAQKHTGWTRRRKRDV